MAGPDRFYHDISTLERDGVHIARQVTAVSGVLKDEVVRLYGVPEEKCTVLPNGVIPSDYQRTVDEAEVRQEYGVPPRRTHGPQYRSAGAPEGGRPSP